MKNPTTIFITGASSGIGRALALLYAAPGKNLLLTGRNAGRLAETAHGCEERGAKVLTTDINVTERDAFEKQIRLWDDLHPVDLAIANAGISGGSGTDGNEPIEQFIEIVETNFDGTLNTVHPLLPRMQARKKGQIALMSSMAGFRGMPNAPAYSVSKVAVRALGEALRPLLAKEGISLSTIHPGFIRTPLTDVNAFPMPFLMEAEEAARIIRNGLEKNKATIAFPWQMYLLSRTVSLLPRALGDWVLSKAPKKA